MSRLIAADQQPALFAPDILHPGKAWPFAPLEPFGYDFIMIDPPWHFAVRSEKGEEKSPQAQYRTMSVDEIRDLPVGSLASKDCILWLWATAPMLPQAIEVMTAWGFRYSTMGAWHKKTVNGKTSFGPGYRLRSSCEPFLIGSVGQPKTTHATRNLIEGVAREHSRKPDEAYAIAEAMMPQARRADVFSRETRPGWEGCGDEAGKFDTEGAAA